MASSEEGPVKKLQSITEENIDFFLWAAHERNPVFYEVVFSNPNFSLMWDECVGTDETPPQGFLQVFLQSFPLHSQALLA